MEIRNARKAVQNVMDWAVREAWAAPFQDVFQKHIGVVCDAHEMDRRGLEKAIGAAPYAIAVASAMEDFLSSECGPQDENIVDDYLDHRGWSETDTAREYLAALRNSAMSLFEVTDVASGSHLVIRDLVRGGRRIRVEATRGSSVAAKWDRFAGRVVDTGDENHLSVGVLPFSPKAAEELLGRVQQISCNLHIDLEHAIADKGPSSNITGDLLEDALLAEMAPLITQAWLRDLLAHVFRSAPLVVNQDGEELHPTRTSYSLAAGAAPEAERRLDMASALVRESEGETRWVWLDRSDRDNAPVPEGADQRALDILWQGTEPIIGRVELDGEQITLFTNAHGRAERGGALLGDVLGDLIGAPETAMRSAPLSGDEHGHPASGSSAIDQGRRVGTGITPGLLDAHYQQILDTKLPILGGVSPRQAALSENGREKVISWLKYIENQSLHRGIVGEHCPYDFGWMWQELGISPPRG